MGTVKNAHERPVTAEQVCSLEGVLYYARERENIRLLRLRGAPAPWTADPVLGRYRFTNVRRRDDRVSQWIIKHVIRPEQGVQPELWFSLLICRLINWPPTLLELLREGVIPVEVENFNPARFRRVMAEAKARGGKVYSGAYMVYPGPRGQHADKAEFLLQVLKAAHHKADRINDALWASGERPSVAQVVALLADCFGLGTFMAGQVAADLTYAPEQLDHAVDLYTWAPIGPGSSRGLNLMLRRPPYAGWSPEEFNHQLRLVGSALAQRAGLHGLTLHDVQNVMCEYSKYGRAVLGEINPKVVYRPETEF